MVLLGCSVVSGAEESGLNLLTPNQAFVGWDNGGFFGATGGGTTPAVTFDTASVTPGSGSIRIVGDGSKRGQGIWLASNFVPENRGTYTFSGYVKGQPGDSYYVAFEEKGPAGTGVQITQEKEPFTITGTDWERFSTTVTMQAGDSLGVTVRHNTATPFDVLFDNMQLELGSVATAWNAPKASKNMVLYNQATLAFDTRGLFTVGKGTTASRDTAMVNMGDASLKVIGDGAVKDQGFSMWPSFIPNVGQPYTFSIYLYGQAGDEFYLVVDEKASNGTTAAGNAATGEKFTLKGNGWERQSITFQTKSNQRVQLLVKHSTAAPFAIWLSGLQLEAGSAATPWEAPAKP
jgi:hypothetical protein